MTHEGNSSVDLQVASQNVRKAVCIPDQARR